jgi:LPS sulfotransferase NodH
MPGYKKQFAFLNIPEKKRTMKERIRKAKYKNYLDYRIRYPEDKFVIYTRGRTGSTVLTELLNCHPRIFCDVEIFNYIYCRSRVMFPNAYIKSCSKRATIYNKPVYGFKVKIAQLRYEHKYSHYDKILSGLAEDGWKFIHLKRVNFLRHKLSSLIASETKVFHLRNGDMSDQKRIKVDFDTLLSGITYGEEVERTEEENLKNIPHVKIIYETDILDNSRHQETADKVFKYLGVPSHPVTTDLKRITVDKLEDMILNYEEIESKLKGTQYEKYLYM